MKSKRKFSIRPTNVMGALAVLLLAAGSVVAYQAIHAAEHKTWTIVYAKSIDAYSQITTDDVKVEERNEGSLPKNAVTLKSNVDLQKVWDKTVLVNQVSVRGLHEGDVLSLDDLTKLSDALPAMLVKCGHPNDLAVAIPVNPSNGMSLSRIHNGDSLFLSIEETKTADKGVSEKHDETVTPKALVIAKDVAKDDGSTGYAYVPLTQDQVKLIQQNGGPSHIMVGLTSDSTAKLEGSK